MIVGAFGFQTLLEGASFIGSVTENNGSISILYNIHVYTKTLDIGKIQNSEYYAYLWLDLILELSLFAGPGHLNSRENLGI